MGKIFIVAIIFSALSIRALLAHSKIENTTLSPGKIIFITGSCSSGKSSMAKIIAQRLNARSFAFDEYVMPIVLKKFIRKHYGGLAAFFVNKFLMRNFFTTVSFLSEKKRYALQLKFYNDLKQGLAVEPTSRMYRHAKMVAMQGQNVVIESPLHIWDGVDCLKSLPEFDGADVTYVLAYCPWDDLVSRIKERNSSKNKKMHRELDWAVINYMCCFDVSPNYHGDGFLEYLNGTNVHSVVQKYSQSKYKKKRMRLFSETRNAALKSFPEETGYYIYPRFKYNITVNTKMHAPEQAAAVILDYFN
jgi:deoxyadenosine/deoxycytidine kinase